ncbi:MAG: hypothetical protein OXF79_08980 [Chloroflexi bacterium]|nr:hypothetical protein [Chloroflexota bacterium]
MSNARQALEAHPAGDEPGAAREFAGEAVRVDAFGSTVHAEWNRGRRRRRVIWHSSPGS